MRTNTLFAVLLAILAIGCQSNPANRSSSSHNGEDLVLGKDLDTAQALANMNIVEHLDKTSLLATDNKPGLSDRLDTLDLTYHFGFCDCQQWITTAIYDQALQDDPDLPANDPRGGLEFNRTKHGFYLEPAHPDLALEVACFNGNRIRLIGREYQALGLPNTDRFTVPDPPKGRVFRYYAYEIKRPYTVWGPQVIVEIDEETGDTLTMAAELTVK